MYIFYAHNFHQNGHHPTKLTHKFSLEEAYYSYIMQLVNKNLQHNDHIVMYSSVY